MNMMKAPSLRTRFTKKDDNGNPVAEIKSKSDLSTFMIMLGKQQATYEVKHHKKTKTRSESWSVTLASPLEALS
jgi:hypothetical protein